MTVVIKHWPEKGGYNEIRISGLTPKEAAREMAYHKRLPHTALCVVGCQ